jgi:hypothetical protein
LCFLLQQFCSHDTRTFLADMKQEVMPFLLNVFLLRSCVSFSVYVKGLFFSKAKFYEFISLKSKNLNILM